MSDIDAIAKDGQRAGSKAVGVLVALGGAAAGAALGFSDVGQEVLGNFFEKLGLPASEIISVAAMLLGAGILLGIVLSFRGAIKSKIGKFVLTFLSIMMGVFILVRVLRLIVDIVRGNVSIGW